MNAVLRRLAEPSSAAGMSALISAAAALASGAMSWEMAVPAIFTGLFAILKGENVRR